MVAGFVFNVNMFMALPLTEWLIARERAARSFAWLRTLPLDDGALAGGKFLLAAVFCVVLWTASSGLFAPALWSPWGTGVCCSAACWCSAPCAWGRDGASTGTTPNWSPWLPLPPRRCC